MNESVAARINRLTDSTTARFDRLTRDMLTTSIWMLSIAAALLGVLARGFQWL